MIAPTILLVFSYIDADTWGWVFTTSLGLYFGANVTHKYAEKPKVYGGIFGKGEYDEFQPPVDYTQRVR